MVESRLAAQNNKCAICHEPFDDTPCADHCHITGQKRGLLCRQCNFMLGHAKDNRRILHNAIEYLNLWEILS